MQKDFIRLNFYLLTNLYVLYVYNKFYLLFPILNLTDMISCFLFQLEIFT